LINNETVRYFCESKMAYLELYILQLYIRTKVITIPCYIFVIFCDFLDVWNDTTEKFAERSGRREFCSRLCGFSRAGMLPSHACHAYILCSTSVYTRCTDCRATHTVARTLTRCFITADLAGTQTRNGSLITTATAINPGMRERQKRQQWDPLLRFTASRN